MSPAGSAPTSVIAGVGAPVVDTAKDPGSFRVKYAVAPPLVMCGAALEVTVMARVRVAVEPDELVAEMVTG